MDRQTATEVDPVVFSNKLVLDTFRSGVLELRPGGRKKLQWVKLEMPVCLSFMFDSIKTPF